MLIGFGPQTTQRTPRIRTLSTVSFKSVNDPPSALCALCDLRGEHIGAIHLNAESFSPVKVGGFPRGMTPMPHILQKRGQFLLPPKKVKIIVDFNGEACDKRPHPQTKPLRTNQTINRNQNPRTTTKPSEIKPPSLYQRPGQKPSEQLQLKTNI